MNLSLASPAEDLDPPAGLSGGSGLPETEAAMICLSVGTRFAHLGLMTTEHLAAGGRRMRARLALAAAEALGRRRADAIPWAAACELLHNATLIHDDIQDGDATRRDVPALWSRYGTGQAINAGDLMLVLPTVAVAELRASDTVKWRLSLALARAAERTARGQSAEMELAEDGQVSWEDWVWAASGKTGSLLALPVEGAAILAGLDAASAARLSAPFSTLGLLYQMQDDLQDLDDIRDGRVTSVVAAWCTRHPDEAPALLRALRGRERTRDPDALVARLRDSDALDAVRDRIARAAASVVDDPSLCSVPALHDVAMELLRLVWSPSETDALLAARGRCA